MANPPPPYDDITGISRTVMKDNAQESIGNYNGNARPGEIVVDLTTNPPTPYIGNNIGQLTLLTSAGTYGNIQVGQYLAAGQVGNIIPSGNAVYTLGNATNQWSDLYVSNATIYMNNVPISLTAGNTLTVNGQAILSNNSNATVSTTGNVSASYFVGNGSLLTGISGAVANLGNLDINGTAIEIAAGATETYINISPNGESSAYVQVPNDATANITNLRIHNDAGNIEFGTNSGLSLMYLDTTGNLTMPNSGYINFVNTGGIKQVVNEDFYIRGSDDEEDGWSIYNIIDDGAGNQLTRTQLQYNRFSVYTDVSGNNYSFDFRDTGEFDVPKSIRGPVGGNLVISIGDQFGSDTFIDLQTRSYVGDALISNIRIANPNVTVSTSSGAYNWSFDGSGNLNLPPSGNIVGITANNSGHINWLGNSSGDGYGYTTMNLVPDDTVNESYLILDPTAPNHIHIRAGGTQDNSGSQLYLGGENSYFKVDNGLNPNVYVSANSNIWTYGTDGTLTFPSLANISGGNFNAGTASAAVALNAFSPDGNTVSIQAQGNSSSAVISIFANSGPVTNNWVFTHATLDPTEAYLYVPGGAAITTPNATGGGTGKNIFIEAGAADQSDYYTSAGGALMLKGGRGAFNDGGGGGPGGNVNINAGESADPAGVAGNVYITAGALQQWVFDNTGNLSTPGSIIMPSNAVLTGQFASPAPIINGFESISAVNFSASGNISVAGTVTVSGPGAISIPNLPGFRVYGNGVTSVSTTTNTTGVLNGNNWAVDYNQGSYLNSTTGVFTAPVAGLYQVNLNARVANNSGSASQAIVYKNYGVANTSQVMWETAANCTVNHFGVGTVSKLAVGDTLSLVVTVGQLTFDSNDSWSVAFLG